MAMSEQRARELATLEPPRSIERIARFLDELSRRAGLSDSRKATAPTGPTPRAHETAAQMAARLAGRADLLGAHRVADWVTPLMRRFQIELTELREFSLWLVKWNDKRTEVEVLTRLIPADGPLPMNDRGYYVGPAPDERQWAVGSQQWAVGSGQPAVGSPDVGNPQSAIRNPQSPDTLSRSWREARREELYVPERDMPAGPRGPMRARPRRRFADMLPDEEPSLLDPVVARTAPTPIFDVLSRATWRANVAGGSLLALMALSRAAEAGLLPGMGGFGALGGVGGVLPGVGGVTAAFQAASPEAWQAPMTLSRSSMPTVSWLGRATPAPETAGVEMGVPAHPLDLPPQATPPSISIGAPPGVPPVGRPTGAPISTLESTSAPSYLSADYSPDSDLRAPGSGAPGSGAPGSGAPGSGAQGAVAPYPGAAGAPVGMPVLPTTTAPEPAIPGARSPRATSPEPPSPVPPSPVPPSPEPLSDGPARRRVLPALAGLALDGMQLAGLPVGSAAASVADAVSVGTAVERKPAGAGLADAGSAEPQSAGLDLARPVQSGMRLAGMPAGSAAMTMADAVGARAAARNALGIAPGNLAASAPVDLFGTVGGNPKSEIGTIRNPKLGQSATRNPQSAVGISPLMGQVTLVAPPMHVASPEAEASGSAIAFDWRTLAGGAGTLDAAGMQQLKAALPAGAQAIYPALPPGALGDRGVNLRLAPTLLADLMQQGYGASDLATDAATAASASGTPAATPLAARIVPGRRPMGDQASVLPADAGSETGALAEAGGGQARKGGALDFLGMPVRLAPSLGGRSELKDEVAIRSAADAGGSPAVMRPEVFAPLRNRLFPSFQSVNAEPDKRAWEKAAPSFGLRSAEPASLLTPDSRVRIPGASDPLPQTEGGSPAGPRAKGAFGMPPALAGALVAPMLAGSGLTPRGGAARAAASLATAAAPGGHFGHPSTHMPLSLRPGAGDIPSGLHASRPAMTGAAIASALPAGGPAGTSSPDISSPPAVGRPALPSMPMPAAPSAPGWSAPLASAVTARSAGPTLASIASPGPGIRPIMPSIGPGAAPSAPPVMPSGAAIARPAAAQSHPGGAHISSIMRQSPPGAPAAHAPAMQSAPGIGASGRMLPGPGQSLGSMAHAAPALSAGSPPSASYGAAHAPAPAHVPPSLPLSPGPTAPATPGRAISTVSTLASRAPQMVYPANEPARPKGAAAVPLAVQASRGGAAAQRKDGAKDAQAASQVAAQDAGAAANEVHLLANEVWTILKRRMTAESERRGRW